MPGYVRQAKYKANVKTEQSEVGVRLVAQPLQLTLAPLCRLCHLPLHALDLISDESTNKDLLRWLRRWDPIVFRRPVPAAAVVPDSAEKELPVGTDGKRPWVRSWGLGLAPRCPSNKTQRRIGSGLGLGLGLGRGLGRGLGLGLRLRLGLGLVPEGSMHACPLLRARAYACVTETGEREKDIERT